MIKLEKLAALRYFHRACEMGLFGTLRQIRARTSNSLIQWSRSLWWGWRARRELSDAALLARTTGEWSSVDALLDHLISRPASSFLLPHESPQETALLLNTNYPEYVSTVLAAADAACRNELALLGQVFHYSQGIDWHTDPVTRWRCPLWHISRMGHYIGSQTRPADLILIWELNRHQHFITLGIAYWLTGDRIYMDAFCSQIQSWIETNPLQHGVNWCYGLEISIRLLAWTAAFQFFRGSPEFRKKIGKIFLKSLWQQVDFLSSHLQTTWSDVPNNHMMAEIVGLAIIGAAFPEFRAAAKWREIGLRLLPNQATAQMHSDGVNKEQATGYHRFVAELLLLIVARSRQDALPNEPILEHILERMLDYILFTLTPAGTSPMWGDSDYGSALGLGQQKNFWDFRPILSAGAALFGRTDLKFAAGRFDEEAFWLLGSNGLDLWDRLDIRPPELTSRGFPSAGLYVIRDSWETNTDVAFFRCGPFGLGGEEHCAHAHCDLLSVILWISGQPLLVDSGTYTYHGPWRDPFRLTTAHNTIMVDDLEQAVPSPSFNWRQIPEANCIDWEGQRVAGKLKYSSQVDFFREIAHPQPGVWELIDKFIGHDKDHKLSWFFHFEECLSLRWVDTSKGLMVEKHDKPYVVVFPPHGVEIKIQSGWVSQSYGIKKPNSMVHAIWSGEIPNSGIYFSWKFMSVEKGNEVKR
jgi:hypothetical protein